MSLSEFLLQAFGMPSRRNCAAFAAVSDSDSLLRLVALAIENADWFNEDDKAGKWSWKFYSVASRSWKNVKRSYRSRIPVG
jgi:hypothetical protein